MSIWQRTQVIAYLTRKAWEGVLDITGAEAGHISLPVKTETFKWMLKHSEPLQLALLDYAGDVLNRQPSDVRLQVIAKQQWLQQPKIKTQPQCGEHGTSLRLGVNPRGLQACEIWQKDVTHIQEFGPLKFVRVTIDTFSKRMGTTAQTGEGAVHVIQHLTACFAVMGAPRELKPDNGAAYKGEKVAQFLQQWGVKHTMGIPHLSTGQASIERAHRT